MTTRTDATQRHPVKVSVTTHRWLQELAAYEHSSMAGVVERAVERYRAEVLLQAHNAAWAQLAAEDPAARVAFQQEQDVWDQTLADGLPE